MQSILGVGFGAEHRIIGTYYGATIDFPWGSISCMLGEDSNGVVYGSGDGTMVTMAIGTPTL